MTTALRVLLVEDTEDEVLTLLRVLRGGGYADITYNRLDTAGAMRVALAQQRWDIIIAAYELANFSGLDALALVQTMGLDLPFIVVSDKRSEEIAVAVIKAGAHDYIKKDKLAHLVPAIRRELHEAELRREQKFLQESTLRTARRFQSLIRNTGDIVLILDADGLCWYSNLATTRILGYPAADFAGKEFFELTHPDDDSAMTGTFDEARQNPGVSLPEVECLIRHHDGSWRAFNVIINNLLNDPSVNGFLLNCHDITERKQAQDLLEAERDSLAVRLAEQTTELSEARAELARTARLKDEFLASMSHELRTPLNAILGMSQVLRNQVYGSLNTDQLGALDHIEEGGNHLLDLINDILDLSKIEAGKLELTVRPVVVRDVCQASLFSIEQAAQSKRIDVVLSHDNEIDTLQVDPHRLKQILVNLLTNAIKSTDEQGQIGLEVKGHRTQQIVDFTVWDTGTGISPEDLKTLFQRFVAVDSSLARQQEGLGIGLALVSRLAELHGGGVSVNSKVGQGSRFTVSLPWPVTDEMSQAIDDDSYSGGAELEPVLPDGSQPRFVLLAEDNESIVVTIRDYLQVKGYRVAVARTGIEALERVREEQPNIILMDLQMPEMSGLEATRLIRTDDKLNVVPIIAITALATPDDRQRCLDAGADEYMSKPVNLTRLVDVIALQLRKTEASKL